MSGLRYLDDVVTLTFESAKCTGCQQCVMVCPHAVFVMDGNRATLRDRDACIECGACARNCESGAIEVRPGVGCAAGIITSWFRGARGGEVTCGPDVPASGGGGC